VARRQVELADVRHIGDEGARLVRPLVIAAARQLGEPLPLQEGGDRRRAEGFAIARQGAADIVDGAVLLAEGDDPLPQPLLFAGGPSFADGRGEEVAVGLLAELMDEDSEASGRVSEAGGRLGRGGLLDEEGAEGLVLPMSGVGGLQEAACHG